MRQRINEPLQPENIAAGSPMHDVTSLPDLHDWDRNKAPRVRFEVQPFPDESLQSILVRSAQEHVLWRVAPILSAAGLKGFRPGRLQHLGKCDLDRLAYVLRLKPDVLISRSIVAPHARTIPGFLKLPKGVVDLQSRWIAPSVLQNAPYHRFAWNVRVLPYCPESGERLVNCCSACGHVLGWFQTRGLATCERCLAYINPSNEPGLANDKLQGYRRIARLLSIHEATRQAAVDECTCELRDFDPAKVAIVAIGLARILLGKGSDKREFRTFFSLPADEMADIVATAGDILADWHNAPGALLRNSARELGSNHADFRSMWRDLKEMADVNGSDLATSELIMLALPTVAGNVWGALKGTRRTYQSQQVLRVLGVKNEVVRRLADAQALPVDNGPSLKRRNVLFDADAVDELRDKMDQTVSLNSVASGWGLPCYAVEQMAALGMIAHVSSRALDVIYGQPRILRSSVEAFANELTHAVRCNDSHSRDPSAHLMPLRNAMKIFGGREKPWGPVIQAILSRSLPCLAARQVLDSNSLLVRMSNMRPLQHLQFERNHYDFPFSSVISQQDAEDLLNITAPTFQAHQLRDALGFKKSGKGAYAAFAKVLRLGEAVVTRTELALRWGISMNAVSRDPRMEGVEHLAFGWDRPQLISRCGIS